MADYQKHPDYKDLPESIKKNCTEKEFAWLGNADRQRLLEVETCPELEGDD